MVAVFDERERVVIVTDVTPFHPRDYQWADQPADRGVIEVCGTSFPVLDAVVIAVGQGGSYYMDAEIPIKKNDPQWFFCVGHVLPRGASLSEGDEVLLSVDENYRSALSRAQRGRKQLLPTRKRPVGVISPAAVIGGPHPHRFGSW